MVEYQPAHSPARTMRSPSAPRRAAPNRQSIATSAVASFRTSGVLVTTMPRAFAASTATCSYPTEYVAMIPMLSGSRSTTPAVIGSPLAHRMPSMPSLPVTRPFPE